MGDCRIRNCQFRHTRDVVCRFWARDGHCARGQACLYRHTAPEQQRRASAPSTASAPAPAQPPTAPRSPSSVSSRSLAAIWGAPADADATPAEAQPFVRSSWSLATRLRAKALQEQFAHVPAAVVERAFMDAGCRDERAAAYLASVAPPPVASAASTSAAPLPSALAASFAPAASHARSASVGATPASSATPWVSTGSAVDAEYRDKRERAIDAAVQRNRLFELATQAFQRGDKKAARDLAAEGRRWQSEMEELHATAAREIFQSRNSSGRIDVLDLHGLHPDEASEIVGKHVHHLRRSAKNRRERTFSVICGTGHHAWNNQTRSKLRDAVVDTLERLQCTYKDSSADRMGGMLTVVVQKR